MTKVATDLKLWCKDTVIELLSANRQLQSALVVTAENNQTPLCRVTPTCNVRSR